MLGSLYPSYIPMSTELIDFIIDLFLEVLLED